MPSRGRWVARIWAICDIVTCRKEPGRQEAQLAEHVHVGDAGPIGFLLDMLVYVQANPVEQAHERPFVDPLARVDQ